MRHPLPLLYLLHGIRHAATRAKISVNAPMQFKNLFASRFLMQAVDILCDNGYDMPLFLPFGKLIVCGIRGNVRNEHLFAVEFVKFFGMRKEKIVR